MLGTEIAPTYDEMRDSVYRKVAGKDFVERLRNYIPECNIEDIMRVADTDMTRIYNEAVTNTGGEAVRSGKVDGNRLRKTWNTMLDDRVRDTHAYLEGTTVPYNAEFYTFDGDHAPSPGGFEYAENNCGCRCHISYTIS